MEEVTYLNIWKEADDSSLLRFCTHGTKSVGSDGF